MAYTHYIYMKKKQDCTFWLSIVSMIISVIAVCVTLIRCEPFTVDGVTLLVGMLSAAVAIYVFLHAINELFVANRVRKSIESKLSEKVSEMLNYNLFLTYFFQGTNELSKTHSEAALFYLFHSLEHLMETSCVDRHIDEVVTNIEKACRDYPAKLCATDVANYVNILATTKHKDSKDLILELERMSE